MNQPIETSTSSDQPVINLNPSSLAGQLAFFIDNPFARITTKSKGYTKLDRLKELIDREPGIHSSKVTAALNTSHETLRTYNKALREDGYKVVRAFPRGMNYFPPKSQEEPEDE